MQEKTALSRFNAVLASDKDSNEVAFTISQLAPYLPDEAIDVMDENLADADPLIQVAIMDAYFEMTNNDYHQDDLERILKQARRLGDEGEQLYMAARIALGRISSATMDSMSAWGDGQLDITATAQRKRRAGRRGPLESVDEITVIIHGTWASDGKWWKPGGDFFNYVKTDMNRPDVYGKSDQFKWSGKNRDGKRKQAATSLNKWLKDHPSREVNVFAHSHGANVAMLATHKGVKIDRLVMMSPPVRRDYYAKWSNVRKAYNLQASFDPVVGIARGGQWFNLSQVKKIRLKASGHSSSHESNVWKQEKLARKIDMPW